MTINETVHESSGNVFADLQIKNADELLAKSKLAARILILIEDRGITQNAAAKLLGISQPRVSALLKGRLNGFSTERLFRFLNHLGCDVEIKVSKARARGQGHVLVMAG